MKKENRIKKNEEIAEIVKKRQKVYSDSFFIYYQPGKDLTRVAISVSKKYGNSVERNHAKRRIREVVRPNLNLFDPMNLIIVVKPELKDVSFEGLKDEMLKAMKRVDTRLKSQNK